MANAKWIWLNEQEPFINCYARFLQEFFLAAGQAACAQIRVAASDNYVLRLNGDFIACGQYKDYPGLKHYDTLSLDHFLKPGKNLLAIDVYYQGAQSFQCAQSAPRLWYELTVGNDTYASGPETLCRKLKEYKQGEMELISPQLSFTFEYDARKESLNADLSPTQPEGAENLQDFAPATEVADRWNTQLEPRPIKKCAIKAPVNSRIAAQGVILEPPESFEKDGGDTAPAKRIYYQLTAPRYAEELIKLPKSHPQPKTFNSPTLTFPSEGYILQTPEGYDGCYILADLGAEYAGYPLLDITAPEGAQIDIGYGEHLEDGRVRSYIGGRNFAFRYTAKNGRQRFINYFKRIAGRYLEMHVSSCDHIIVHNLTLLPEEYPLKRQSYPMGLTDALGRRIWDTSARTLELCMHEHYEDCPWREQALYAMDARNQALAGYYAFKEFDFPAASWALMAQALLPDGQLRITSPTDSELRIPSFTFAWAVASGELAQYGGIERITYISAITEMLDKALKRRRNGLLLNPEGAEYWNFYEWSNGLAGHLGQAVPSIYPESPYNAFFCGALRAGAFLCRALNDTVRAEKYERAVQELKNAFEIFWDDEHKAYCTGKSGDGRPYSELTQALALKFELVPPSRAHKLRERLAKPDNGLEPITLSHYIYKIDTLMQEPERYFNTVYEEILSVWGSMIFKGCSSFWETIDGADAFDKAGSLCHGWSAAPIYFFGKWASDCKTSL